MTAMVSTDRVLAFAAMSLLVIVIPGPSVLFVIGRALAHGRRTAVATALGNVFGSYLLVVAVAIGIGSLVERSAALYLTVKLAGGADVTVVWARAAPDVRTLVESSAARRQAADRFADIMIL